MFVFLSLRQFVDAAPAHVLFQPVKFIFILNLCQKPSKFQFVYFFLSNKPGGILIFEKMGRERNMSIGFSTERRPWY